MAKSQTFTEKLLATGLQKHRAAQARNQSDGGAEKPRDVILASIALIADALADEGFSYRKSGPRLTRSAGDFTFSISFQSDRNNIAGERAAVWIHASVESKAFAAWHKQHRMPWQSPNHPAGGSVAGGQIGNLVEPVSWMEWDFADPERRAQETDSAVGAIRKIILPFFALFSDPAHAIRTLMPSAIMGQARLLEYTLAVLGPEAAEEAGQAFLAANLAIRQRYETALSEIERNGLPRFVGDLGRDIAAVAIANGLNLSVR